MNFIFYLSIKSYSNKIIYYHINMVYAELVFRVKSIICENYR